ncbi:MAG: family 16 glycoside hydrolase [Isosphaeraceae bacterium]
MPLGTENTTFSRDVFGRYICNTMQEALDSTTGGGKPFDVIVIGGGSFGGVIAHRLFQLDSRLRQHRILVLEGGPFVIPEHVQNLPTIGDVFAEVRRVPWQAAPASPNLGYDRGGSGLAYCLAGRSLFFGGWSPQLTDSELAGWPAAVVKDLKDAHFNEARRQIGTDTSNDFIFGPLHDKLIDRLFTGINQVTHRFGINTPEDLEAPLAVVSAAERAGTFPLNKFSAMPLLMDAARKSWVESNGDDRIKRLMIVANCTVNELGLTNNRVTLVRTSLGDLAVPADGAVVVALGTIESARLALRSFPNTNLLIGCNLMAHLRSNFTMRIPRRSLNVPPDRLYASALFVKGKSPNGHFHLQITASAAGPNQTNSEAELFRKIPDIDTLDYFDVNDESVIITLRGIGEMTPAPNTGATSRVDLIPIAAAGTQAVVTQKAQVTIVPSPTDQLLWKDLDSATDEVASVLAADQPYDVLIGGNYQQVVPGQAGKEAKDVFPHASRHDLLGTTHHEAGTLWMDPDPTKGVTDIWGRFHEVPNAWVAGPALFPSVGSPNPMLTGVALARRAAERMFEKPITTAPAGPVQLFDGATLNGWTQAGPGNFVVDNGTLRTQGGLGLLWYSASQFRNFELAVDWKITQTGDNSGIFMRFPDPNGDPFNAVREGYEVQIDDLGNPDGALFHKTGAIYDVQPPLVLAAKPPGQWNTYVIRVVEQTYNVTLNGQVVISDFVGNRSVRGFIGLQNHLPKDVVFFRNIVVTPL